MERKKIRESRIIILLALVIILAVGCAQQPATSVAQNTTETPLYTGVLRADDADALDVTSQLALGTIRLEETADAVTEEQAADLLPLWEALQGTALKSQAERLAMAKQIEDNLTDAQVTAIAAMQFTQADAETWLQDQGPAAAGDVQGGGSGQFSGMSGNRAETMTEEDRAAMREQFQGMSDSERASMREQYSQQNNTEGFSQMATAGNTRLLMRTVITLLTERSGQTLAAVISQPSEEQPSATPEPTATESPVATATETATDTPIARVTLVPWSTPDPTPTPTPAESTTTATADASTNTSAQTQTVEKAQPEAQTQTAVQPALEQVPDTDPGPPLTVEITTNYAEPNPNLEGGMIYNVGGFLHNPTDETYAVTAVHVTFYDTDGFRGAFYAFPKLPGQRGIRGEYIWHGAMEADVTCTVLGPGESCPFTAEIAGQNMGSFLVHPDAIVAEWHEAVSVTLSDTKVEDTGTSYVRISGTATNANAFPVKNVVISGLLLDENGQIVSMGTATVASIETGGSSTFTIHVEKQAYTSYQLTVLAEQDAK